MYFSGHFITIFRSIYFHLKLSFFLFIFFNIRYIYANVFKIFKFELNPLDNKKDISLYVLFRTFQVNFQDISVTPEIVVPGSGISFLKFPVSRHLLKLFYDELCSFSTIFALNFDKKLAVE
jgi:hypothetical protein